MNYAIAVGIFLVTYVLGFVLPLVFGGTGSVIRLAIFSLPVILVAPRVAQRFSDGTPLVTEDFRRGGGFLYGGGAMLIWIGHLLFFGSIAAAFYLSTQRVQGVPIGLVTGYAMFPYLGGIVLIEIAYRQWSKGKVVPRWKAQLASVVVIVGAVIAAQLTFNVTSDRPVDLLSYSEREALAWGNGYSKEVKRVVENFYDAEGRMPCVEDNFFDDDSLLPGTKAGRSNALSIDIVDCGRFVATIHRPIDGIADGQLLFVATVADAGAETALEWQCFSPQLERIERHTKGRCTYDQDLGDIQPPVVAKVPTAVTTRKDSAVAARSSGIQDHLDRLNEPTLWEDCGHAITSYRIVKFDSNQYVASVRMSRESQHGRFRSATSSSIGKTKGLDDGFVEERRWNRIEGQFATAGFWQLRTEVDAGRSDGDRIYVEACSDGRYHAIERDSRDRVLAPIVKSMSDLGRLDWLEGK